MSDALDGIVAEDEVGFFVFFLLLGKGGFGGRGGREGRLMVWVFFSW